MIDLNIIVPQMRSTQGLGVCSLSERLCYLESLEWVLLGKEKPGDFRTDCIPS